MPGRFFLEPRIEVFGELLTGVLAPLARELKSPRRMDTHLSRPESRMGYDLGVKRGLHSRARTGGADPPEVRPPSLQQRFRRLGRDAILDAASELFLRNGYRNTTIGAIAELAAVGVATVFRYFRSKEGVLAGLSRRDIDRTLADARVALKRPADSPADGIISLILPVFGMHQLPSTQIRGQTRLWLLIPTGHAETDAVVTSSDCELQELILELLAHYRRKGQLARTIDLKDLTIIVFALFYHHYLRLAFDRSLPVEAVKKELARQLRLLFAQRGAST